MGLFDATMLAEASKAGARIFPTVTIDFPDYQRRWAPQTVISTSLGGFEPKILNISEIQYGTEDREGKLMPGQVTVKILDVDQDFATLNARFRRQMYGSVATIDFLAEGVTPFRAFTGIYIACEFADDATVTLTLRVNDLSLQRVTPRFALSADFKECSPAALATYAGPVYGTHDGTALGLNGAAVACPYVDTIGFRYFVSLGRVKSVLRVYSGTTLKTLTTHYTVDTTTVNGRLYTLINFLTDQGAAAITADVEGVEATGDGSGAIIHNPISQLRHFLHNFVWSSYTSGNWLTSGAPLDEDHWDQTEDFLDVLGIVSSRRISGSQVEGLSLLNELAATLPVRFWWTNLGELAVAPWDFRELELYENDPWIRQMRGDFISPLGWKEDQQAVVDRLDVKYCFIDSQNKYVQSFQVRDTSQELEAPAVLELRWSPARIV